MLVARKFWVDPVVTIGGIYRKGYYYTKLAYTDGERYVYFGYSGNENDTEDELLEKARRRGEKWFVEGIEKAKPTIPEWLDGATIMHRCFAGGIIKLGAAFLPRKEEVSRYVKWLEGLGKVFEYDGEFIVDSQYTENGKVWRGYFGNYKKGRFEAVEELVFFELAK